jgi:hypothetical protein
VTFLGLCTRRISVSNRGQGGVCVCVCPGLNAWILMVGWLEAQYKSHACRRC